MAAQLTASHPTATTAAATTTTTPVAPRRFVESTLVAELRAAAGGAVHVPGGDGYDAARGAWQVLADQRPLAVAYPADATEVAAVIRAAADAGVAVVPQGTGHNAMPLGTIEDAVLLRTTAMRDVTVDPQRRIARVGSGAIWEDVVDAVAPHGLMALHGSSPDVGVAGYSLGGGTGWYARKLGLQANNLTAVELVTADGRLVRASANSEPELFWALRGGGGNFGVVTAFEMQLHPITTAYAGWLVWDWKHAHEVLSRFAEWAPDAPDEVTTSARILQLPPLPAIPEPLRGRQIVAIDGAVLGDDATAEAILAPLRELRPEMDWFGRKPAAALSRLHGDPEGPTPGVGDTAMLASLPQEGVDALVAATGPDSGSHLLLTELRQLGGALGRPHPGGGVLDRFEGQFLAFALGVPMDRESAVLLQAEAHAAIAALGPWQDGRQYQNFVESAGDPATFWDPATYQRLRAVRAAMDPEGRIRANHRI